MKVRALLLIAALVAVSACGQSTAPTVPSSVQSQAVTPEPAPSAGVSIRTGADGSASFSPATVSIPVGGAVEWSNEDGTVRTIAADDGSWSSSGIDSEVRFLHVFPAAGTYGYHLAGQPEVTGTIVVK